MSDKRARERAVVQHLLRPGHIDARVESEGEAPDFLVALSGRRIGVEVTQYVRGRSANGSSNRQQHVFIQDVLARAKGMFESRHTSPLYVTVDWVSSRASLPPDRLAAILVNAIEACLAGTEISLRPFAFGWRGLPGAPIKERLVPPELAPLMDRITVVEMTKGSVSRWRIRQSGDTKAEVGEFEELIASKEPRIDAYLKRCDEVWLAIDAFGGDILQAVTPTRDLVEHCYLTRFARVFLVDLTETDVHQLWTAAPEPRANRRAK